MAKNIFWIASYPKSGNTLMRIILNSLFFTADGKGGIKKIGYIPAFEKTERLNPIKKINSSDFINLNKLDILYKYFLILQSKDNLKIKEDFIFLKTHNALVSYFGHPFTNEKNTIGYIYIIRDPRDVAISWSHHSGLTLDDSINFMINDKAYTAWGKSKKSLLSNNIEPKTLLLDWETHVNSWDSHGLLVPKLTIKYENLVYNKKETIYKIVNFFSKNYNFNFSNIDEKIDNIINETNINYLQKSELENGFNEAQKEKFFRKGEKNQWKEKLNDKQIKLIENKFKEMMLKYDYKLNFN